MAYERFWAPVGPTLLTADGTNAGVITIASTNGLYVRQRGIITAGANSFSGQVKEVLSATTFRFGPDDNNIPGTAVDLSAYLTASGAKFYAHKQRMDYNFAGEATGMAYDTEPIRAFRVMTVDPQGNYVVGSGGGGAAGSVSVTNNVSTTNIVSNAAYQFAKVAAASITSGANSAGTAFTALTLSNPGRVLAVFNSLSSPVGIGFSGSQVIELEAQESVSLDLASNSRQIATGTVIGVWNISGVSTTGTIRFSVIE